MSKMNPEIKADWIAALRSGDYEQGQGFLAAKVRNHIEERYCCLGVLCDLAVKRGVVEVSSFPGEPIKSFDDELATTILPHKVAEWAGLEDRVPKPIDGYSSLASYNDDGLTFDQIADIIEWGL